MSDLSAIDEEIDSDLLALLREKTESKLVEARNIVDHWQDEIQRLQAKLSRIEERMVGSIAPTPPAPNVSKGGRIKKGVSDKLVTEFMQAANGVGANLQQITASTGTTISSARRTIKKLMAEKKVEVLGRARWKWIGPVDVVRYARTTDKAVDETRKTHPILNDLLTVNQRREVAET